MVTDKQDERIFVKSFRFQKAKDPENSSLRSAFEIEAALLQGGTELRVVQFPDAVVPARAECGRCTGSLSLAHTVDGIAGGHMGAVTLTAR